MAKKKFAYYSFDNVLSRNAIFSMVMGARGLGKTYGAKKFVIRNAINKGQQFIYLRRYKEELKGRFSFFADIAHEFPEYEFRVNGANAEMRLVDDKKWETIGYFIPLSTSQSNKSVAYPLVTTIIFDEFIIEKGAIRYLPNEVKSLLDFYSTVDRWQDRTRVLMLSNAISIMNPYFIEYKIEPSNEFVVRADGSIVAHFVDSNRFASQVAVTRFGSFIINHAEGYADYSISNSFSDNNDEFVMKKSGTAEYWFTIKTKAGMFSVWHDGPRWFAQQKRPKSGERIYCVYPPALKEGEILLTKSDSLMSMTRTAYRKGRMYFDSSVTRNALAELFVS